MTSKELYWAAGFLEGEGCFATYGSSSVSAAQVNKSPLVSLQALFGGGITHRKTYQSKHRPSFQWYANGPRAVGIMLTLYTLLTTTRQKQIIKAIYKWKKLPGKLKKVPCTKHNIIRCRTCYNKRKAKEANLRRKYGGL